MADHYTPRDGSLNYQKAWNQALSLRSQVAHLGITSWNYYGEGSQISRSQGPPNPNTTYTHPNENWGPTPSIYIDLTAHYATEWNDIPFNDAEVLQVKFPAEMQVGLTYPAEIVVRNRGDSRWSAAGGYELVLQDENSPFVEGREFRFNEQDPVNEIGLFGGIFRGRPVTFRFNVTPKWPGQYNMSFRMIQQNVAFFGSDTGLVQSIVSAYSPGKSCSQAYTGSHDKVGLSNGDNRFLCLDARWYDCGWEYDDPTWETKVTDNQKIGSWSCDLPNQRWIRR
jgi:hypothetical protein